VAPTEISCHLSACLLPTALDQTQGRGHHQDKHTDTNYLKVDDNGQKHGALTPVDAPSEPKNKRKTHLRNENVRDVGVQLREPLAVHHLGAVVDLPVDQLPEVVDDRGQVDLPVEGLEGLGEEAGIEPEHVQVERDGRLALGPLDLDCHEVAVHAKPGLVHLEL